MADSSLCIFVVLDLEYVLMSICLIVLMQLGTRPLGICRYIYITYKIFLLKFV